MKPKRREAGSQLLELFAALGIQPKDASIYETALTHRSVLNESANKPVSNERMEFLGDSVLGHAVAGYLYEEHPELSEGQLARKKSVLVSEAGLAAWATRIDLGQHIRLGKGEEQTGGREKPAILADALEAVLGAIYLDLGWDASKKFVRRCLREIPVSSSVQITQDSKSRLQEHTQHLYKRPPVYRLAKSEGPDHAKRFEVEVVVQGKAIAVGKGKTKKEAEQDGAEKAMKELDSK